MSHQASLEHYAALHRGAHRLGLALQRWAERSHADAQSQREAQARRERLKREHLHAEQRREETLLKLWQQPRGF